MNAIAFVSIGFVTSTFARLMMKHRWYSRFDDFLFGVLGALLGGSLNEVFDLPPFGPVVVFMMAGSISMFVLFVTGLVKGSEGTIVRRVRVRTLRRRFVQSLVHGQVQSRNAALPRNNLLKQQVNTQTIRMGEV